MIRALHLLWIIPVAGSVGFLFGVVMAAGNSNSE